MNDEELIRHYLALWYMRLPTFSKCDKRNLKSPQCKNFFLNENSQDEDKQTLNIRKFPDAKELLFPLWIMDRLKEAMDQSVEGDWWSSIALCGMIVEFLAKTMPEVEAYKEKVDSVFPGRKLPERVAETLMMLRCCGILDKEDFERLDQVRNYRNEYLHLRKLSEKEKEKLKSDNFEALKCLLDFFDMRNMKRKYLDYLKYLLRYEKAWG